MTVLNTHWIACNRVSVGFLGLHSKDTAPSTTLSYLNCKDFSVHYMPP